MNLDTPIGPEELWTDANSCARCRSPTCAVPYEDQATGRLQTEWAYRQPFTTGTDGADALAP